MTTVLPAPPRPAVPVTWIQVDRDLWTASTVGEFRGTVQRLAPGRFAAVDGFGTALGEFAELATAKDAVRRGAIALPFAA